MSLWWVLLPGPRVIGGPCGGSVCRPGRVTSDPAALMVPLKFRPPRVPSSVRIARSARHQVAAKISSGAGKPSSL